MDYTVDDLRGKWVRKYTPDCTLFLEQLHRLHLTSNVNENYFGGDVIAVCDGDVVCGLWRDENDCLTDDTMFTLKPQWSVYTNDKPLCELSDEQAAALFNAWRSNSEQLEAWDDTEWFGLGSSHHIIKNGVYRIKQKSECELFVEGAVSHGCSPIIAANLFNAGCRFTEGN